jgi:hypothetical protein
LNGFFLHGFQVAELDIAGVILCVRGLQLAGPG